MPSPGGRPARAVNASTSGLSSSRIAAATAAPSRTRALTSTRRLSRRRFEFPKAGGAAQHDELIAVFHDGIGCRVELHAPACPLDADHDDAEPMTKIRLDQGLLRE